MSETLYHAVFAFAVVYWIFGAVVLWRADGRRDR